MMIKVASSPKTDYNLRLKQGVFMKMMDFEGQTYGAWKILKRDGVTNNGFAKWLCQCKCGKQDHLISKQIASNRARKQCGCENDIIGKKFGKLSVLQKISGFGNYAAKFLCACDCGNEKIIWGGSILDGSSRSCGCARSRTEMERCITICLNGYYRHAKRRKLDFLLSREDFEKLISLPCFYCGTEKSNTTKRRTKTQGILKYFHNGVDRIDSSIGYTLQNCVSCCKTCNLMKGNLDLHQWISHLKKIINFQAIKQANQPNPPQEQIL